VDIGPVVASGHSPLAGARKAASISASDGGCPSGPDVNDGALSNVDSSDGHSPSAGQGASVSAWPVSDAAPAKPGPDLAQIQAAFRDAGAQVAIGNLAIVNETIGHIQGLDKFLDSTLGAGRGANLESLKKLVAEMKHAIEPHAVVEAAPAEAGAAAGATQSPAVKPVAGLSGTIQTRADVIKALGLICDFYRQNEPSSPVPLILQRGLRLVDKDFMAIMSDLTPDALKQLQVITGAKPEK